MLWNGPDVGDTPRNSLSTEKRPRGIDIQCPLPLLGRHVDGVLAADYACETAQDIDAPEVIDRVLDGTLNLVCVRDVDFSGQYPRMWEVCAEVLDLLFRM